jgi:hypothetical protein
MKTGGEPRFSRRVNSAVPVSDKKPVVLLI